MSEALSKKELMMMTKPRIVGYAMTAIADLTKDRNWQRSKKASYQSLYTTLVKESEDNILRADYDNLRNMNNNQAKQITDLHRVVHALKATLKEVL